MAVEETTLLSERAVAQGSARGRKASTWEVDLAITELAEERVDRRQHDRLVDDRRAGPLEPAWDEGLLALIEADARRRQSSSGG